MIDDIMGAYWGNASNIGIWLNVNLYYALFEIKLYFLKGSQMFSMLNTYLNIYKNLL